MAVDTAVEVDKLDQVEVAVKLIEAAPTDIFFQLADVGTFEVAHRVPEGGQHVVKDIEVLDLVGVQARAGSDD